MFFKNKACPVNCDYCMVTQINQRSSKWRQQHRYGLNKTLLFINKFPDEKSFNYNDLYLEDDFVGFEGISDPFWDIYRKDLFEFLERASKSKKIILVTKWRLDNDLVRALSDYKNLAVAVSCTGLDRFKVERTSMSVRVKNLELLEKFSIPCIPLIHPYIDGMSDLSFLKDIKSEEVSVKGFRFNEKNMPLIARYLTNQKYFLNQESEVLIDTYQEQLYKYNKTNIDFREWSHQNNVGYKKTSKSREDIINIVDEIIAQCTISSSESDIGIIREKMIERRYDFC